MERRIVLYYIFVIDGSRQVEVRRLCRVNTLQPRPTWLTITPSPLTLLSFCSPLTGLLGPSRYEKWDMRCYECCILTDTEPLVTTLLRHSLPAQLSTWTLLTQRDFIGLNSILSILKWLVLIPLLDVFQLLLFLLLLLLLLNNFLFFRPINS